MALFLDVALEKLFGSWYSPALCLALLTVVLLIIVWVGGASDWVYKAVQWTGVIAVVAALGGGWMAKKKSVVSNPLAAIESAAEGAL